MAQAEGSGGSMAARTSSLAASPTPLSGSVRMRRRPSMWSVIRRQRLALTGTIIVALRCDRGDRRAVARAVRRY
jgi:hypothetical protein